MAPTVHTERGKKRQMKRSDDETDRGCGAGAAAPLEHAETVGESGSSPVRAYSEGSSEPKRKRKRKCISRSSDCFGVKRETFAPSSMSSSERRELRTRLLDELDLVRGLLKKPEFLAAVPVNGEPEMLSSAAPWPKKRQWGSRAVRGAKGRFLPAKPKPKTSSVLPEATPAFKQCEAILKRLMTHKYSYVFNVPVDVVKLNIPDYNDIVKHPMDLGTIKKKLKSCFYLCPSDFAADVRLTFANAMAYNPRGNPVNDMAIQLNKIFESRWKTIEKKFASAATEPRIEVQRAESKRIKTPADCSDFSSKLVRPTETVKPKMTFEEKESLGNCLASLSENFELPAHIIDLLQQCIGNKTGQLGDVEIEIDIHTLSDDILFVLKKHVDKYLENRDNQETRSDPSENEATNVSGPSHSSTNPCKDGEAAEEDVDICGNAYPILLGKDEQNRTSTCGSSSCSSSRSGSSSSDSDSGSDTESESEEVLRPEKLAKGDKVLEQIPEQEKSDVISTVDAKHTDAGVELPEQDSESKASPEGENAKPDSQISDKLLRAAILRARYADVIVKASVTLSQGGGKQEDLEKLQREEKARLLAEANAAMEARRAEARAEANRKRDLDWEKAQVMQEVERAYHELEILGTSNVEHIMSSVAETSSEKHSQDGVPIFLPGSGNPLEKLGLFMKKDEEEQEDEPKQQSSQH